MDSLVIRPAESSDVDAVVAVENACFTTPWSRESLREEIESNPRANYVVAELGDKIVGYMGMWLILDEGHITNVAVLPEYRNRKIAGELIRAAMGFAEQQGVCKYTLEVRKSNQIARSLYEKFGFQEFGLRKGYYQDNKEDAVIMWREDLAEK